MSVMFSHTVLLETTLRGAVCLLSQPFRLRPAVDAGDHPHGGKQHHQRRAAVADKRQRQPDNGHDEQAHAHVDDDLEDNDACHADADVALQPRPGVPRHVDAPQDNDGQQQQRQHAAHHPQLLADHGEDEVRVAVGQAGGVLALGLYPVEQPLPEDLAAAQRQKAAGLLPAGVQRVEAVVKQDDEPLFHIVLHEVQIPHGVEQQSAPAETDQKPPESHPRHKAHTAEHEQEHQRAAHVRGDLVVQHEYDAEVHRQHGDGRHGAQVAVLLQPRQLLRQHEDERDLHDLRRLDIHRQERKFQPCAVSGVPRHAEGRQQQKDKRHAHEEYPLPVFDKLVQVDLGHHKVQHHADEQRRSLHQHVAAGVGIPGGTGDHQQPEQRRAAAQRQQQQIGLPQHVSAHLPYTAQHGGTSLPVSPNKCTTRCFPCKPPFCSFLFPPAML